MVAKPGPWCGHMTEDSDSGSFKHPLHLLLILWVSECLAEQSCVGAGVVHTAAVAWWDGAPPGTGVQQRACAQQVEPRSRHSKQVCVPLASGHCEAPSQCERTPPGASAGLGFTRAPE